MTYKLPIELIRKIELMYMQVSHPVASIIRENITQFDYIYRRETCFVEWYFKQFRLQSTLCNMDYIDRRLQRECIYDRELEYHIQSLNW